MQIQTIQSGIDSRLAGAVRLCALLLFLVVAPTAYAAVYKCAAKDGSTTYSDMPCELNSQAVEVKPAPLHTTPAAPPTPLALNPQSIAAAREKSEREKIASLCSTKDFNDWIKAQGHPLPAPNVRMAKLIEISNQCRRTLGLSDMLPPAPIPAPKPILQGSGGEAAADKLKELVKSGSIEQLQKYLSSPGVDINDRPGTDEALLDYAADQNQAQVARFLLQHGARVDAAQTQGANAGYTALHRAAIADAAQVAELLLALGAEVNVHGPLGITPLILAASNGSRRTAEVLLNHGADVSVTTGHRETAFSEASAHNHADIVQLLLIHVPTPTSTTMNALAMRGDLEGLRLILKHDQLVHDVSAQTKDQAIRFTILGPDRLDERKQIIELLLSDGADIDNQQPGLDVIPVMLAPTPEMAEFLFAHGANNKAKLSGPRLAQWLVCNNSGKDPKATLQVVVAHGIDISGVTPRGDSALPCAEQTKNTELIAFLVAHQVGGTRPVKPVGPTSSTATAAASETPLFPKRACVRLDQSDNSHTPMDLYASLMDCMHNNRDADAVGLFALAGMDSAFDAVRVSDKTAGQARQILIMGLFQTMPANEHQHFETAMKELADHPQGHAVLCEQVKKIGPPQYYPSYMVNHGMGAVMGALSNQAPPPPLSSDFNAAATWTELQTKYLNCTGT